MHLNKRIIVCSRKKKLLGLGRAGLICLEAIYYSTTIEGMGDYDPQSFLTALREVVTIFLRTNRGTKVKLIIRYNMERASIVSETRTITEAAAFHSGVEVNVEGTDVNEIYNTMFDTILENFAIFQMQGGNWTVKSIITLEIHTVAYERLRGSSSIPLRPKRAKKRQSLT